MPPDYALMNQLLFEGKHEPVKKMTEDALAEGRPAMEVLEEGLIAGMRVVGEDFKYNRVFVPEVLLAARAMKAGMAVLKPLLTDRSAETAKASAVIVMGTVKGDLHDIGKNLCIMMLRGAGFTVVDLGVNVPPEKFVEEIGRVQPDIVGFSAFLTTTMPMFKANINALETAGIRDEVIVLVGGAPVTQEYADAVGADGYSADASSAVKKAKELIQLKRAGVAA